MGLIEAWDHELAAAAAKLEAGQSEFAESALERLARADGAPVTAWLMLGDARQRQSRYDEAEQAFAEAIRRDPANVAAHEGLATLRWMRTKDIGWALQAIDAALRAEVTPGLLILFSRLLTRANMVEEAFACLDAANRRAPAPIPALQVAASIAAAAARRTEAALHYAQAAVALAPTNAAALESLTARLIEAGETRHAQSAVAELLRIRPADQAALALQGLIWRAEGDPRYDKYFDYPRLVRRIEFRAPLFGAAQHARLEGALDELHDTRSRRTGQSHQGGTKLWDDVRTLRDLHVDALFTAFLEGVTADAGAIDAAGYRRRDSRALSITAAWSVRLESGGRHSNHVHPEGCLSAVYYIRTGAEAASPSGRLEFGQYRSSSADFPTEYAIRPEPHMLVIFPSYFFHQTSEFRGPSTRLAIAFDLA